MLNVVWLPVQFKDSSDDDLYRLDFEPEGQGHQCKMISISLGSYFGAPKKNRAGDALGRARTLTLTLTAVKQYVDSR